MINIELFKTEWNKLVNKLEQINNVSNRNAFGDTFTGISVEQDGVSYNTEHYYSGCGTDYYFLFVSFEELNNPISYFEEKYREERRKENELVNKLKEKEEENSKKREFELFQKLKEKYKE